MLQSDPYTLIGKRFTVVRSITKPNIEFYGNVGLMAAQVVKVGGYMQDVKKFTLYTPSTVYRISLRRLLNQSWFTPLD